jgi:lactate dehydrogenase-like 2-hydroxyacid dehydrogenase
MSEAQAPTVLLSNPTIAAFQPALEAEGWRVLHGWDALGASERRSVRAIFHNGSETPLTPDFLDRFPNLGLIACVSTGYDGVDVAWCRSHGIEVTYGAGINAADVADHALGLVVAAWRDIAAGDRDIRAGLWRERFGYPMARSLTARRLGIAGLGAIGQACAARAEAFGMEVAWWGPRPRPGASWPRRDSLLELAAWSDILLVAARAAEETRGLISRKVIEAVGPEGLIVNVARGSLLDEDALVAALKDGRLGKAALDVFDDEPTSPARWADVRNAVLTPHMAGRTSESVAHLLAQALENLRRYFAHQPPLSPVPA